MATLVDSGGGSRGGGVSTRLQSRTALLTVLLGIYLLLMANNYLQSYWTHSFIQPLKYLSVGTSFVTQVAHVAIIYGIFVKKFLGSHDELLYALCASLASSMVFTPLSCFTIIAALCSFKQEVIGLWEMPRVGFTIFHMYLIRHWLKELRASEAIEPLSTSNSTCEQPSMASSPSSPATPQPSPPAAAVTRPNVTRPATPPPATPLLRSLTAPATSPSTESAIVSSKATLSTVAVPSVTPSPSTPVPPNTPPPTPPATSPPHSSPPSPTPSPPPPTPPTRTSSSSALPLPPPSPPPPPPSPRTSDTTQETEDS